jgi:bacterial surface protein 26-residue repeat
VKQFQNPRETLGRDTEGTFGTSEWRIDSEGVLYIGAGQFAPSRDEKKNIVVPWYGSDQITKVIFEGKVIANADSSHLFDGLVSAPELDLENLDTSNITNMDYMFSGSNSITELNLTNFNTSNVTTMKYMFNGTSSLNTLDLSSFNTANVRDMTAIFKGTALLADLDLSSFNTSNVVTTAEMFNGASSLTTLDLSNFDTSNVKNMNFMFRGSSSLTTLDLSSFDTSNVTTMNSMFNGANSLTTLDLSSFDTSKVRDMSSMFADSKLPSNIDLSSFNTSSVTDMKKMFQGAILPTDLSLSGWDVSNVKDVSNMFRDIKGVKNLNLSNFNTANTIYMGSMFNGANSLTTLDISNFDTSKVNDIKAMFEGTSNLSQLSLGEKFNFGKNAGLENIEVQGMSGKWINVSTGTVEEPIGGKLWSSSELMENYNGSTDADTYVWQKDKTEIKVHDSEIQVGAKWSADDNFDQAFDKEGNVLNLTDITVSGDVDTNKEGKYEVIYINGEVSETAVITVLKVPASVQGGNVTVKYQDESGKSIASDVILKGKVGENYSTDKKIIKDYDFKEVKGNTSGIFNDKAQTVTYFYKKNATTPTPNKQEVVNVYRLYNKKTKEHLYTANKHEYDKLPTIAKDWVREGVNFKGYKSLTSTTVAVRRVYNPKSGEHLMTTDVNEVKVLKSKGWKDEGVSFYAPKTGGNPIYRLFNAKAGVGAHFITADAYEKKVLTTAPKEWKYEGLAWRSVVE